jgi:hypothetical protein
MEEEPPQLGIPKVAAQTTILQVEEIITVKTITATVKNNNALGIEIGYCSI